MKKSIVSLATALVASILFASCASIPEPSKKDTSLVYGILEFNFENYTNADLLPTTEKNPSGTTVKIQNRETKKNYSLSANKNGEFLRTNIPAGNYELVSFSRTIKTFKGADINFENSLKDNNTHFYFSIADNCVTNMGKMIYKIDMKNTSSYRCGYSCNGDFSMTKAMFKKYHPDSLWLLEDWITMNGKEQ